MTASSDSHSVVTALRAAIGDTQVLDSGDPHGLLNPKRVLSPRPAAA